MNNSNENVQKLEVIVPSNMGPGQTLNVEALDQRIYSITIPENVHGGDAIVVLVPNVTDNSRPITVSQSEQTFYPVAPEPIQAENVTPLESSTQVSTNVSKNAVAIGATTTALVLGTLVIGPVTGIVVAGAALYATTRSDSIGNVSRSIGHASVASYRKSVEVANQYQIGEKLQTAYTATVNKASEIDREYKLTEKATSISKDIASKAKEADAKYKITENVSSAISRGFLLGSKEISRLTASASAKNTSSDAK